MTITSPPDFRESETAKNFPTILSPKISNILVQAETPITPSGQPFPIDKTHLNRTFKLYFPLRDLLDTKSASSSVDMGKVWPQFKQYAANFDSALEQTQLIFPDQDRPMYLVQQLVELAFKRALFHIHPHQQFPN